MKRVVLAFSGGLNTTACIDLLRRRKDAEVIAFTADLGQRASSSSEEVSLHALSRGGSRSFIEDLREKFVRNFIWPALRASAVYESGYMLSSALARPLIVEELVRAAHEVGAHYIAHGCNAKSNDQVRFENAAAALAPELTVLSPLREAQLYHSAAVRDYLTNRNIPWRTTDHCFSITENLWGTTFQWAEAPEANDTVPESHYRITTSPQLAPDTPLVLTIGFKSGVPVALDGKELPPVELLGKIAAAGCAHGVGRLETFEDRLIGIKTRDVYEQPAATILHEAKRSLERLILSKDMLQTKAPLSARWAQIVYDGFWFSEVRESLDAYFQRVNLYITGDARVELYKGRARVIAVNSPYGLYQPSYASTARPDNDNFDQSNVDGYMKSTSTPIRMQMSRQHPLWHRDLI